MRFFRKNKMMVIIVAVVGVAVWLFKFGGMTWLKGKFSKGGTPAPTDAPSEDTLGGETTTG